MKSVMYHESAIQYNSALAEVAEAQADEVEDPEVQKWCRAVGKQHRFHEKRHRSALSKMHKAELEGLFPMFSGDEVEVEAKVIDISVVAQQSAFAKKLENELNDGEGI